MSFKDKLPKLSRPIVASAAILGGAFLGGEAKADTTPAPEPAPATQAGWTWDRDDKLNGFDLAPTNGLKVVTRSADDALDPEKKYHKEGWNLPLRTLDGMLTSTQEHTLLSDDSTGNSEYKETLLNQVQTGSTGMVISESSAGKRQLISDKALAEFTISHTGSNYHSKNGEKLSDELIDYLDGGKFLLESQTDRLNVQQWTQDSINGIIAQKGDMAKKIEALKTLGHLFVGTLAPELDALPNPDNVQACSGGEEQFDAMYQQKLADVAAGRSVQLRIGGLKSTKTGQTLAPEQLKALAGHSK